MTRRLNEFEIAFIQGYVSNGFRNATDAYRRLKPHVSNNTARVESCRLLKHPHIVEALQTFKDEPIRVLDRGLSMAPLTKADLVKEAREITGRAKDRESFGAALKGIELQGRFIGAFDGDEDDMAMYNRFIQSVSVNSVTINVESEEREKEPRDVTPNTHLTKKDDS